MTNSNPSNQPDPRPGLSVAMEVAVKVAWGVSPDQYQNQTPCDEYTVAQLMGHLVCVFRRIELVGRRSDAEVVPLVVTDVETGEAAQELRARSVLIAKEWSDDSILGELVTLPFGRMPGAAAAALYTSEVLTHAWDLAVSTGQDVDWPQELLSACLEGAKMGVSAELRGGDIPFGPVVEVDVDSSAIEQLVAWVGRNPSEWR